MIRPRKYESLGFSAGEVAEAFGLSRNAIYAMAKAGKLPCVRLSERCLRFPKKAIKAMVRNGHHMKIGPK